MPEEFNEKMYTGAEVVIMIGLQIFGVGLLVMLATLIMFVGFGEHDDLVMVLPLLAMMHIAALISVVASTAVMLKAGWAGNAVYFALGALFIAGIGGAGYCWRQWLPLGIVCVAAALFAGLASLAEQGTSVEGDRSISIGVAEDDEHGEENDL